MKMQDSEKPKFGTVVKRKKERKKRKDMVLRKEVWKEGSNSMNE